MGLGVSHWESPSPYLGVPTFVTHYISHESNYFAALPVTRTSQQIYGCQPQFTLYKAPSVSMDTVFMHFL